MKKHRIYRLKIGSWRLYLANCRLKKMNPAGVRRGSKSYYPAIMAIRRRRYKLTGGCCELCGCSLDKDNAQMHHVLPMAEFPQYATNPDNLEMVCDECHHALHLNPYANLRHMEQKAQHFGFNLQEYFNEKKTCNQDTH